MVKNKESCQYRIFALKRFCMMGEHIIDLSGVSDRSGFHLRMSDSLSLPEWYGGNLDALYDILTEDESPLYIRFTGWKQLQELEPAFFEQLGRLFSEVRQEMPGFDYSFEEDPDQEMYMPGSNEFFEEIE